MQTEHKDIEIYIKYRNKKWVTNSKGAPTDVPILGPVEIENYIYCSFPMFLPICRFQNILRIQNRTIISIAVSCGYDT